MDIINNITNSISKMIFNFIYFLDNKFTNLVIFLITIIGAIIFFLSEYLCCNKYTWKKRVLIKTIRLCIFLFLLKGVIQILL